MAVSPKLRKTQVSKISETNISTNDPHEAAEYIGDMAIGLRQLADQSDLTFLAYLLDLVYEETTIITRNSSS
ncbi:MAG: hypothetical protein JKY32_15805 [Rhizobiales bacterium]|nr:hypothetical protein [Hyphomicrobiales bacterium]